MNWCLRPLLFVGGGQERGAQDPVQNNDLSVKGCLHY
jgi:hypothetical protein